MNPKINALGLIKKMLGDMEEPRIKDKAKHAVSISVSIGKSPLSGLIKNHSHKMKEEEHDPLMDRIKKLREKK